MKPEMYKDCEIKHTEEGFVIYISPKAKLPGIYLNRIYAEKAIDRYKNARVLQVPNPKKQVE